jgi:hypothetical protein
MTDQNCGGLSISLRASRVQKFSLSATGESSLHFSFRGEFAGIRLPQPLANVVRLPAVNIKIGLDRFVNDVASIPVERGTDGIECLSLFGVQAKTDSISAHNKLSHS